MATKKSDTSADDVKEGDENVKDDEGDATDPADGGKHTGFDGLEQHVRELVKSAVESLVGDGGKVRHTATDDEERLARLVKDAQAKIRAEEERENRFKSVEETLKKVTEKPPSRDGLGGKIQKWLWGEN